MSTGLKRSFSVAYMRVLVPDGPTQRHVGAALGRTGTAGLRAASARLPMVAQRAGGTRAHRATSAAAAARTKSEAAALE